LSWKESIGTRPASKPVCARKNFSTAWLATFWQRASVKCGCTAEIRLDAGGERGVSHAFVQLKKVRVSAANA
jgi:hypothetical protein